MRNFQFKDMTVPLTSYSELLSKKLLLTPAEVSLKSVIVLQSKDAYLGLLVDAVDGQIDSVILPFDGVVKTLPGFKGTTLLGSDGLAYIISVQQMVALGQPGASEKEIAA